MDTPIIVCHDCHRQGPAAWSRRYKKFTNTCARCLELGRVRHLTARDRRRDAPGTSPLLAVRHRGRPPRGWTPEKQARWEQPPDTQPVLMLRRFCLMCGWEQYTPYPESRYVALGACPRCRGSLLGEPEQGGYVRQEEAVAA